MLHHTPKGMTSPEVAALLFAAFLLVGLVYLGSVACKAGSDRRQCIINLRNIQTAGRSWEGMYSRTMGPFASSEICGPGRLLETEPTCPTSGNRYIWAGTVPPLGTLFATCPLAAGADHHPTDLTGW